MDIRTHTRILKDSLWFVLLMTVVLAVAGFFFAYTRPVTHVASVAFQVNFVNRPDAPEYRYGGYYEQKSSEMYVQQLMSLFQTPSHAAEMYLAAGVSTEGHSGGDLTRRFNVKQLSNQNFVVEFGDPDRDVTSAFATNIVSVVEQNVATSGAINETPQFTVQASTPFYFESRRNPVMAGVVGALIGIIGSVVLVYIKEYFTS